MVPSSSRIKLITCLSLKFDFTLFPYFVRHYQALGVQTSQMHVIINTETNVEFEEARMRLNKQHGIMNTYPWLDKYTSHGMWNFRRDLQKDISKNGDWILSADIDEFHEYPKPLPTLVAYCEKHNIDIVQGVHIDRIAPNNQLSAFEGDSDPEQVFPIRCDLSAQIRDRKDMDGTLKLMLFRSQVAPGLGGHGPIDRDTSWKYLIPKNWFSAIKAIRWTRFLFPYRVHHFKWRKSVIESTQRRMRTKGASPNGTRYGKALLNSIRENSEFKLKFTKDLPLFYWLRVSGLWRTTLQLLNTLRIPAQALFRINQLRTSYHSIPRFEGKRSCSHKNVLLARLRIAGFSTTADYRRLSQVSSFVMFIGFPRSGHSLIASIIRNHPNALIAHELDVLGLVEAGMPVHTVLKLIERNHHAFVKNGQYWNGFCYQIESKKINRKHSVRILGDKKGDWTAKRLSRKPELIKQFEEATQLPVKCINVTRHPFDNISTMAQRRNRNYDRENRNGLEKVSLYTLNEEIKEYFHLCHSVRNTQKSISPKNWHTIELEQLIQNPATKLKNLFGFLNLPLSNEYTNACKRLLRSQPNFSRIHVQWPRQEIHTVQKQMETFEFLSTYSQSFRSEHLFKDHTP